MATSKPIFCACCNTLITAPQFHNGKAYGYTCITKIVPSFKRTRDNGLWIAADSVTHEQDGVFVVSTAIVNGYKFQDKVLLCRKTFNATGEVVPTQVGRIQNGMLKVAKHKNGTDNLWRTTEVFTKRDSKGKLYPVSVVKHLAKDNEQIVLSVF